MSFRITQEILAICQPEEVLILSGRDLVPWLCVILEKYLHRGQKI